MIILGDIRIRKIGAFFLKNGGNFSGGWVVVQKNTVTAPTVRFKIPSMGSMLFL